jgi:hypothetical protein
VAGAGDQDFNTARGLSEEEKQMSAKHFSSMVFALGTLGAGMLVAGSVAADDIAQIKVATGTVTIERGAQRLAGVTGLKLRQSDVIHTDARGSVGITFTDNTMLSAGPNSVISLDRYAFNSTTHEGRLDASMRSGTLSVVSGKIAKQSPDAMTIRTPAAILGVRGTEFFVRVGETKP